MPDPHDTLSIFAEVSVALAGFSGIVIAFGRRSIGSLTALEIRRLNNLFLLSGLVLIVSLAGVSLLHVDPSSSDRLWRWGSAATFLVATPWLIFDVVRVFRLEAAEKMGVNPVVLVTFNTLAVATLVLQLVNWISIGEAWPFFLALVMAIVGAFQQFILLVRAGFSQRATPDS